MKRQMKLLGLLITLLLAGQGFGQDPVFTQYFSTPLYYNPALTGINSGIRARFAFRDQWPALPNDFKAYYFSADLGDRNLPGAGGFGLMVNSDNEGIAFIRNLEVALTIGVRIPITRYMSCQVGIKAAVKQKVVNWDDFVFTDQLSEKYGNIYTSDFSFPDANKRVYPDFGAGGVFQFANDNSQVTGTAGFAVDHLFRPDESFLSTGSAPLPRKWIIHGDAVISTGEGSSGVGRGGGNDPLKINIGVLFLNQAKMNFIEVGFNLLKYNIYLGAWFKSTLTGTPSNSLPILAGYRFTFAEDMSIKFIYSYDIPVSGAMLGTGGAHEVSLVLEFDKLQILGSSSSHRSGYKSRSGNSTSECPAFY